MRKPFRVCHGLRGYACAVEKAADALHCARIDAKPGRNLAHALYAQGFRPDLPDDRLHAEMPGDRSNFANMRLFRSSVYWRMRSTFGCTAKIASACLAAKSRPRFDDPACHITGRPCGEGLQKCRARHR